MKDSVLVFLCGDVMLGRGIDAYWLGATLSHLSWDFGTIIETMPDGMLVHGTRRHD